jgi:bifunctional non-homologous end joining protein LigD
MRDRTTTNPPHARAALETLRPQILDDGNPGRVADPVIEPLWTGIRALAAIDRGSATLVDEAGDPIDGYHDIRAALAEAALAERLVADGFLTKLAARDGSGVYVGMDDLPSSGQLAGRSLLGVRRNRAEEATQRKNAEREARTFGPDDTVTFVAVDLLWVDDESLLEVPFLERRRILESVLSESDLVRRGIFVRPPIEAWIGSWRALGFTGLSFKGANARYRPAAASPDWVSTPMPRR